MPRVSVIMAAHNAAPYLAEAIESVQRQTEQSFELIIVDDRSTDDTRTIAMERAQDDDRIKVITNSGTKGPGATRNCGLEVATGDWVTILDADDWFEENRIEVMISETETLGLHFAADDQAFVHDSETPAWRTLFDSHKFDGETLTAAGYLKRDRLGQNGNLGLLKPLVSRDLLETHGIRYPEIWAGEDFFFLLSCFLHGRTMHIVNKPLYNYRSNPNSISRNYSAAHYQQNLEMLLEMTPAFHDAETLELLKLRARNQRRFIQYKDLVEKLKRGNVAGALGLAAANPGVLPEFTSGLLRYASFQIGRRLHSSKNGGQGNKSA